MRGGGDVAIVGVVSDSRAVVPGNAFVALPGESVDGHAFLGAALVRGAVAVVIRRGSPAPSGATAVIEVDDTLRAFGSIARAHVQQWRRGADGAQRRVVGITGSAGKTTTKDLLACILRSVSSCHATTGNLNNRIGVPAVALGLRGESFAVFELGTSLPGEIAALAGVVEPDVAVLLNVGVAHAAGFGGEIAAVGREKGAIFEAVAAGGAAVVNADDEIALGQLGRTRARPVRFGVSETADVRVRRRELVGRGSRVTIDRRGTSFDVSLPVAGAPAALALAAAIAAADATLGREVAADVIAASVSAWQPSGGRAVTIELEGGVLAIDDSYNANPASMRAAFSTLSELRGTRRGRAIAVLGEMRELGPIAEAEHEQLGVELARLGVDLVVGCGGAIHLTLERAARGGVAVRHASSAIDAGAFVAGEAREGDVVLFKGSRAAGVEQALAALVARRPVVAARGAG
jgi:UDP-N-acetylmuramoyl-tripeptide--D-alanyl-D-alanine ligase